MIDLTPLRRPALLPRLALAAAIAAAIALAASAALAIPGSTQNPDGSWTGPNGEDLGGGTQQQPEPKASQGEGNPTLTVQCGCGYMVVLRDGQTRAQGLAACKASVQAQSCTWPGGVYPGDKG